MESATKKHDYFFADASSAESCWLYAYDAFDPAVVSCINSFSCSTLFRYKGTMIENVPRIFEAVFQCTLEVGKASGNKMLILFKLCCHVNESSAVNNNSCCLKIYLNHLLLI